MTQHNNWKDEFDKEFPNEEGLYNTESGWCLKADPKRLKSFIDTLLIKRTKEVLKDIDDSLWGYKISTEDIKGLEDYKDEAEELLKIANKMLGFIQGTLSARIHNKSKL